MNIAKSILSVVAGYFIFALPSFAFFKISGQAPHQTAPLPFMVASMVFGAAFALFGGYVAAWLAPRAPLAHGIAVAVILAAGATGSLLSTLGKGLIWSQVAALALMTPCAVLGGWLRARTVSRRD